MCVCGGGRGRGVSVSVNVRICVSVCVCVLSWRVCAYIHDNGVSCLSQHYACDLENVRKLPGVNFSS